jgi:hypothetical protein
LGVRQLIPRRRGETVPFSIQLYTVRKALEEDLAGTIRRLADIGFTMIEPYHFVAKAAELKRAMAETFHILDTMASISESIDTRAFVSVDSSVAPVPALPEDWDPTASTL